MPQNLTTLGKLFDDPELRLRMRQLGRLEEPVGTEPLADLPGLEHKASGARLNLLEQSFEAGGDMKARVELLGAEARPDPFGTGLEAPLSTTSDAINPGLLSVDASFDLKTEAGAGSGETRLSARAGASGALRYRHYLPLAPDRKLGNAVSSLVGRSRLPNLLDAERLPARGEVHALEAKLRLDLAASGRVGAQVDQDLVSTLSGELSQPLEFDAEASLRAALGLSLFDRISLVVGRAHQHRDGWLRIRVHRTDKRRLSLTCTFALDLEYDFGTGLAQLFEEMLDQAPVPRLVRTAETVTATLETGDWDTVQERLTGEMEEVLDELVSEGLELATGEDRDWRKWLAEDPRIGQLVDFARKVVEFDAALDPRVRSLWERLVSKADLGPDSKVRKWLATLAEIDRRDLAPEDLLGGEAAELIGAVEAITGRSIEEIVLDAHPAFEETLGDVAGVASQTLELLTETPDEVLGAIRSFAERTGISRTVDRLRRLDSKEKLEGQVSGRIRTLAGRLVDKGWKRLTKSDLERIRSWAERVHDWLPDPTASGTKAHELAERIESELRKVRMDYGLSIGLEIERVSRSTALLDVEIDHRKEALELRRKIAAALRTGRIQGVLEVLAEAGDVVEPADGAMMDLGEIPPAPPYLLRECVFTSERIRCEALGLGFSLVGLGLNVKIKERGFDRRIEQSTLRARATDDGTAVERTGTYAGAFQRGDQTGPHDAEGGVWLVSKLRSRSLRPEAPFDELLERYARLTFSWESEHVEQGQIGALSKLLSDLGFQPAAPGVTTPREMLEPGQHARAAFEIRFDAAAVERLLAGSWNGDVVAERRWNRAFLNAAHRWLSEGTVRRGRIAGSPWNLGHTVARVVGTDPFRQSWRSVGGFFGELGGKTFQISRSDGPDAEIEIGSPRDPKPITGLLQSILLKRERGWKAFRALRSAYAGAIADPSPAAHEALSERFADTWKRASLHTLRWPSSLGAVWLWLAAIEAVEPELLGSARGVALVRRRQVAAESPTAWRPPRFWTLRGGIQPPPGMFPVRDKV